MTKQSIDIFEWIVGGGYVTMLLIFDILLYVAFEANENKDV